MLKVDLHIHTIASGHAYNSILEYIQYAKEAGMDIIGISDHGPSTYGSMTNNYYFSDLHRVPKKIGGLTVLKGIEANIINREGELDMADKYLEKLDYVMAGFHRLAGYDDLGVAQNTE